MPYHRPVELEAFTTSYQRTDIPKPYTGDNICKSVEQDLLSSFKSSTVFKLYQPSDLIP